MAHKKAKPAKKPAKAKDSNTGHLTDVKKTKPKRKKLDAVASSNATRKKRNIRKPDGKRLA